MTIFNHTHLMIDIETLGHQIDAPIVSIAAVPFLPEKGQINTTPFLVHTCIDDQLQAGRTPSEETLLFWLKTNPGLLAEMISKPNKISVPAALATLKDYILALNAPVVVIWGNSARFDIGILAYNYYKHNISTPWHWMHEMCFRTFIKLNPCAKNGVAKPITPHSPLDDCIYQINVIKNGISLKTTTHETA